MLATRIRWRLDRLSATPGGGLPPERRWLERHRATARKGLREAGKRGFLELGFSLSPPPPRISVARLTSAAEHAVIRHAEFLPIGMVGAAGRAPRPHVAAAEIWADLDGANRGSYNFWALDSGGDFYALQSFREDKYPPERLFWDTRLRKIAEAVLYAGMLYSRLGVPRETVISIGVIHGGLLERFPVGFQSALAHAPEAEEGAEGAAVDQTIPATTEVPVGRIGSGLVESDVADIVRGLSSGLFQVFEGFRLDERAADATVEQFIDQVFRGFLSLEDSRPPG